MPIRLEHMVYSCTYPSTGICIPLFHIPSSSTLNSGASLASTPLFVLLTKTCTVTRVGHTWWYKTSTCRPDFAHPTPRHLKLDDNLNGSRRSVHGCLSVDIHCSTSK